MANQQPPKPPKKQGDDMSTPGKSKPKNPNLVIVNKPQNPRKGKAHRWGASLDRHWENGLRRVREACNRSQASMGSSLGIEWSPANISKLERSSNPQIALLIRYAEALGVRLQVSMVWDDVKLDPYGRHISSKRVVLPLHFDPHTHIDGDPI